MGRLHHRIGAPGHFKPSWGTSPLFDLTAMSGTTGGFPASATRSGWFRSGTASCAPTCCRPMSPTATYWSKAPASAMTMTFRSLARRQRVLPLYVRQPASVWQSAMRVRSCAQTSVRMTAPAARTSIRAPPDRRWLLRIVNRHSQLCLDVQAYYVGPGAYIWQYTCDLGYNQQVPVPSGFGLPHLQRTELGTSGDCVLKPSARDGPRLP
jgi:hypothetical protein